MHRGPERWIGRGPTEDEALDDAIARMLPSHVARDLLLRAISAMSRACEVPRAQGPQAAPSPATPQAPAVSNPAVVAPPAPPPPPAAAPRPPRAPGVPATREAGIAALDALMHEIEGHLPTFAKAAPDRQRTLMLLWICRARRVEEAFPGEHEMERRASAIARRLSDLAKMFWPGSVRALQLGARPSDVPELRVRGAPMPRTWAEAALVADRLLKDHLAEAKAEGLDPEGWVTADVEAKIQGSPEKIFTEASATIDQLTAALPKSGKTIVADGPALDKLVVAAKKLRWTRTRVKDTIAWGAAVGRLRKMIPTLKSGGTRIREAIDPKAKPEAW